MKTVVLTSAVLMLVASHAARANSGISGAVCIATGPALTYTQFGVHYPGTNNFSPTASAACALPNQLSMNGIQTIQAVVYDRNEAANLDVSCTVYGIDSTGFAGFTQTQKTSGWSATQTTLTYAVNGNFAQYATALCVIPQQSAAHGFSHVTTFLVSP